MKTTNGFLATLGAGTALTAAAVLGGLVVAAVLGFDAWPGARASDAAADAVLPGRGAARAGARRPAPGGDHRAGPAARRDAHAARAAPVRRPPRRATPAVPVDAPAPAPRPAPAPSPSASESAPAPATPATPVAVRPVAPPTHAPPRLRAAPPAPDAVRQTTFTATGAVSGAGREVAAQVAPVSPPAAGAVQGATGAAGQAAEGLLGR